MKRFIIEKLSNRGLLLIAIMSLAILTSCEKDVDVTSVTLDKSTLELIEGGTATLVATVSPNDATDKTVAWSSNNTGVATVTNGTVNAVAAGTATITATAGGKTATCIVTVSAAAVPVTNVSVDVTTLNLNIGEQATIVATVTPDNASEKTVVWTSDNTDVATVANGTVTAVAAGTATITAAAGGKTATCEVTVNAPILVDNVTLDNSTIGLNIGEQMVLVATVNPDNATDKTVVWASDNANVATVVNGTVTAIAAGTATITATAGEISATCVVTVSSSIAINATTFPDGEFRSYIYTKFDSDKDSLLSQIEIANAKTISVGGTTVTNLKGVEYFTQITDLKCYNNNLTSLDVSKNTLLETLYCYQNSLTTLDLSNNTQLKGLYCYNNNLTSLNLGDIAQLTIINCSSNNLTSLDISLNTQLTTLRCKDNSIQSLNIRNNTLLAELYCSNNNISSLDVNSNVNLVTLDCSNNNLSTLDVSRNAQLDRLYIDNNSIASINTVANVSLRLLSCSNNNITALDFGTNAQLRYLYCNANNIATLDISNTVVLGSSSSAAYLGAQKNEGTITVTMTAAQSGVFAANFAADENNARVTVDAIALP